MWPVIAGSVLSGVTSLFKGNQQRKYNDRAEREAREHNIKMWNMQNEYNHPSAQMARLQEAGLNPNMIYGTSPSSAVGAAGDVSPAKAPEQPYELDFDPMGEMLRYANVNQHRAQTDNLRVQNTVLTQDALLKGAQRSKTLTENARTEFDLMLAKELYDTSVDAAKENVRLLKQQTIGQEIDNYINDATKAEQVKNIVLKAQSATEYLKGQKLDNELKEIEREWNRAGMTKNDALWMRFMAPLLQGIRRDAGNIRQLPVLDKLFDYRDSRKGKGISNPFN